MLGDAPAPDHRHDGADRERAGAARRAAPQQDEHRGPHSAETITSGRRVAGQAVVDVAGVGVQHDEPGDRERAGDDGGRERAHGEVALEVRRAARRASLTRNTAAR